MEGWTVSSALAAVTQRIRLATFVSSVGYRNPALLAKIAARADLISGDRLAFGIGAAWFEAEYRQYRWEFPPRPTVRIRKMEEAVRLVIAMWTEKRTTFHGRYFHAEDAILESKPTQKPPPDHDRRRRRTDDAACGRAPVGCLQRGRRPRCGPVKVHGAAPALPGREPGLRHDRADQHHQLRPGALRSSTRRCGL